MLHVDPGTERTSRLAAPSSRLARPLASRLGGAAGALVVALLATACPNLGAPEKTPQEKAEFHYQLANNSFYAKDTTSALGDLYKALELDPDHAKAHHLLGFIYFGRRQFDEAEKHFRRAMELDPKMYDARANLGALYLAQERWHDAVVALEPLAAEQLYPTPHLVQNNLGFAWYNLGDHARALHHLQLAVFLKPEMCLAHNNLGRVYLAQGQVDLAVRAFDRATRAGSGCEAYVEPYYWLGELYSSTGQRDLAHKAYARCVELGPETPIGLECTTKRGAP